MGAAALGTLNVTVIGDIYGGRQRAAALGYNSSVLSAGTASYPVIGDALARFGWFYPFALPLVAIPVGIFAVFSLRNPEPESEQGLKEYFRSTRWHLPDRAVVGLVGVSLLTLVALLGPQFSYLPILMNDRFDAPTHVIGGVLSGASLTTALVSFQLDRLTGCPTGRLTGRFSEKTLLRSAFLLHAAGLIPVAVRPTLLLLRIPRRCSSASPGAAISRTSSPS